MTTYTAALEALDVKRGHVHTVADWHRISAKALHSPEAITEDDLVIIGHFEGDAKVAQLRERRRLALAPEPAPAPAPKPSAPALSAQTKRERMEKKADKWADSILDAIVMVTRKAIGSSEVRGRFELLEKRIEELEQRPASPTYEGTHTPGRKYSPGALVTKSGGLWLATAETIVEPGHHPQSWRLIVKSGGGER